MADKPDIYVNPAPVPEAWKIVICACEWRESAKEPVDQARHAKAAVALMDAVDEFRARQREMEPNPPDPKQLVWMQELGAEVDRRHHEHRGAYPRLDWAEWEAAFRQGLSPADALKADMERRAAAAKEESKK
jgi:hypothetical protein